MRLTGTGACVDANTIGKNSEAYGIALTFQQFNHSGRGIDRKFDLVEVWAIRINALREIHRGRSINQNMATQIGFLFVALHEILIGARQQFPVEMPRALAGVVLSMLGKLNRETVKRTFVQTCNEAFHSLFGQQLETSERL